MRDRPRRTTIVQFTLKASTLHARAPVVWLSLACIILINVGIGSDRADKAERRPHILDLTKTPPKPGKPMGVPGAAWGAITDTLPPVLYPPRYRLPIKASILTVRPTTLRPGQEFLLELLLSNTGLTPYYLPSSQDEMKSHRPGNTGRRSLSFRLWFLPPDERAKVSSLLAIVFGSETRGGSLRRIEPHGSVLVRLKANLKPVSEWLSNGVRDVEIQVVCSEQTLEDGRYYIKALSERVNSENGVTLTMEPEVPSGNARKSSLHKPCLLYL